MDHNKLRYCVERTQIVKLISPDRLSSMGASYSFLSTERSFGLIAFPRNPQLLICTDDLKQIIEDGIDRSTLLLA